MGRLPDTRAVGKRYPDVAAPLAGRTCRNDRTRPRLPAWPRLPEGGLAPGGFARGELAQGRSREGDDFSASLAALVEPQAAARCSPASAARSTIADRYLVSHTPPVS